MRKITLIKGIQDGQAAYSEGGGSMRQVDTALAHSRAAIRLNMFAFDL